MTNKVVALPETDLEKIKIIAKEEERDVTAQIRYIIRNFIKEYETTNGTITLENE